MASTYPVIMTKTFLRDDGQHQRVRHDRDQHQHWGRGMLQSSLGRFSFQLFVYNNFNE